VAISRVCGVYEVLAVRVPGTKFKVKVVERSDGTFAAFPNVCLRAADGTPDGVAGLGATETEALEDALKWFMAELAKRAECQPEDFEWVDPVDF
jgi:hypothetical protein